MRVVNISNDRELDIWVGDEVAIVLTVEDIKPVLSALYAYVSDYEGVESDALKVSTLLSQLREVL
jgi:hypothetical protein